MRAKENGMKLIMRFYVPRTFCYAQYVCICDNRLFAVGSTRQKTSPLQRENDGGNCLASSIHEVAEHTVVVASTSSYNKRNLLQPKSENGRRRRKRRHARRHTCSLFNTATMESKNESSVKA